MVWYIASWQCFNGSRLLLEVLRYTAGPRQEMIRMLGGRVKHFFCETMSNRCRWWPLLWSANGDAVCKNHLRAIDAPGLGRRAPGRSARLNALNDVVARSFTQPMGLFRTDGKRPDGVTFVPWQSGKSLCSGTWLSRAHWPNLQSRSWGRHSSRDGSHSQRGEIRRPRCSLHLWVNCGRDFGRQGYSNVLWNGL